MKEKSVEKIFSQVSKTYECVNHVLTLGLDIIWRRRAAKQAACAGGKCWLDLCSGTGDMAVSLQRLAKEGTKVVAVDFCLAMLKEATSKPEAKEISFCLSNANSLPFLDNSFDLLTISFATRNINAGGDALLRYFQEFRRVIKPGGRFIILETTQPRSKLFKWLFHLYINLVVFPIGSLISGSKEAYKYLAYTIPRFFTAEELSEILSKTGFAKVSFSYMSFGVCAIHTSIK
tara:strand:- start:688 stop:1383 length:696 start_codon:yes stop_codon:yes gene_type:complete